MSTMVMHVVKSKHLMTSACIPHSHKTCKLKPAVADRSHETRGLGMQWRALQERWRQGRLPDSVRGVVLPSRR